MQASVVGDQDSNFIGTVGFNGTRVEIRRFAEENKCYKIIYTDGVTEIMKSDGEWYLGLD